MLVLRDVSVGDREELIWCYGADYVLPVKKEVGARVFLVLVCAKSALKSECSNGRGKDLFAISPRAARCDHVQRARDGMAMSRRHAVASSQKAVLQLPPKHSNPQTKTSVRNGRAEKGRGNSACC